MISQCYVSTADYARYWSKELKLVVSVPTVENRTGPRDRRAPTHERRWDSSRGRRFRQVDRRER